MKTKLMILSGMLIAGLAYAGTVTDSLTVGTTNVMAEIGTKATSATVTNIAVAVHARPTRTPTLATVADGVCWITSQDTDFLTIPQDGGAVTNSFAASAIGVREAYSILVGTNSVTWPGTNSTTFAWDTGQEVPTSAVPYSVEAISESYKTNFIGRVRAF